MEQLKEIIPYLVPVLLVQLILQIWSTIILIREETKVKFNKKWIWAVAIWVFSIVGSLVFLLFGRDEG